MTFPVNRPHERRFGGPDRPSNERRMELFDEVVRKRIAEVVQWLDGQNVIREAELLTEAACPQVRRGDPGE